MSIVAPLLRLPMSVLSPSGDRARLSILIFHRVLAEADPLFPETPTARSFEAQLKWVREWFVVLPLREAVQRLYAGTLPGRALCISFDDGYADNEAIAAPVLQRLGLTATFFVSTAFLEGGCMWNDRVIEAVRAAAGRSLDLRPLGLSRRELTTPDAARTAILDVLGSIKRLEPDQRAAAVEAVVAAAGGPSAPALMMRPDRVRHLRAMRMDVGAHTMTHPILSRLDRDAARAEIAGSKAALETILGEPVPLFAYPNGVPGEDYGADHARLVEECGFEAAVSTAWGSATRHTDRYQLPRFTPWDRSCTRYGLRLAQNLLRDGKVAA